MLKHFLMFLDTYHQQFWHDGAQIDQPIGFYSRKAAIVHKTAKAVKVVAPSKEEAELLVKKFLLNHKGEKNVTPSTLVEASADGSIIALETPSDVLQSGITEARSVLAGTR